MHLLEKYKHCEQRKVAMEYQNDMPYLNNPITAAINFGEHPKIIKIVHDMTHEMICVNYFPIFIFFIKA